MLTVSRDELLPGPVAADFAVAGEPDEQQRDEHADDALEDLGALLAQGRRCHA